MIVSPIVGFYSCSMFCCAFRCVHFIFAIVLIGKREKAGFFALYVFLVSRDCCAALTHDATGLSAVCGCDIS